MHCWFQRRVLRDWWVSILEWQWTICIQPIIQLCRIDNFNSIVKICKSRRKSMAALNFHALSSSNKRRASNQKIVAHIRTDPRVPPSAYLQAITYMLSRQIWVVLLIGWIDFQLGPIRSTTQIWLVTHHQYGISALAAQTSFPGENLKWWRREMSILFLN